MSPTAIPPLSLPFRRLAWSNLAAQSAEQIGLAAAPIVAVLALGAGAGGTGLLQTVQTLPFLLLSLPAGLLADRSSRRRLMAAAEALRALSLIAILILAETGGLSLGLLAALGFLGAAGTVAYSVAAPSLIPDLVPRAALPAANGRIELARSAAFAAGPALAGALVAWAGGGLAFAAAAALSVLAVVLLRGIREPVRPAPPPRHILHDLREGAVFVLAHPLLRPVLLTAVFFNIGWFVLQAIYVPYAVGHLGLSAAGVGATLAVYGVGMVLAALAAPRVARALPFGTVLLIGPFCGLAGALLMLLTVWVPSALVAGLAFFLFGAGPILWTIASTTLRQAVTPPAMLGRVSAIITMATYGSRPLGAAIGALVGGSHGAAACLAVAVLGFIIQALVISGSAVPRLAALPEAA
ncbi:putative MFS family arabinose efflux permease [Inquilinus ginsengisoli]|uniref:MFS family arabinose efflux permease n=1 Tax=Inquilinus ginsengisoli TaxID=363840 RepID=A0ABU1JNH3_9PROT|nr:MFS transporter [Inquilinus ginsengisoli]MDR6290163.1 putative MFS family arabinose efflux permease [Inquilinus ginsengisoli]